MKTFESEGQARASVKTELSGNLDGIPITKSVLGGVDGLPKEIRGTFFIVSRVIAEMLKDERNDLLIPNETVRDEKGRIIGCKSLGEL